MTPTSSYLSFTGLRRAALFLGFALALAGLTSQASAQSSYQAVYTVLQNKCQSCHNPSFPGGTAGGLDFSGSSTDVYTALVGVNPSNTYAVTQKHKRVMAGDPYRSQLWRKINRGLDSYSPMVAQEGDPMPQNQAALSQEERELIRQWIVFGARNTGNQVDTARIRTYYQNNGIASIATPPPAPPVGQGFQVKLGPFFLAPGAGNDEIEYYLRYPILNDTAMEVKKVEHFLGDGYSHHFIIYRYTGNNNDPAGLRINASPAQQAFVTVSQESEPIPLPIGTAFSWAPNTVLDLNTHYINYSPTSVLEAVNYVNIYTQAAGTAIQEMYSDLYADPSIYIPNDGLIHTFVSNLNDPSSPFDLHLWRLTSHTHARGRSFEIYERNANGTRGDTLFSAQREEGDPNQGPIGYDYQHPPTREWQYPFRPISVASGFQAEVSYVNNTAGPIAWGPTSDDEMLVYYYMYMTDTSGLGAATLATPKSLEDKQLAQVKVWPNPSNSVWTIEGVNPFVSKVEVYDALGKRVQASVSQGAGGVQVSAEALHTGVYVIRITDSRSGQVRLARAVRM